MTGEFFSSMVLNIVFMAIAFYVLYHVVRAAVRDGIKLARKSDIEKRGETTANNSRA